MNLNPTCPSCTCAMSYGDADQTTYAELVKRALDATPAEHLAARDILACPICDAKPGTGCTYGALAGKPWSFRGRVHTRRLVGWLQLPCNTEKNS